MRRTREIKMIIKSVSLLFFMAFLWPAGVVQAAQLSLEEGIQQLAVDIATQMKERNIKKIAVDDFTDLNGYKSALGDFISEELVTNFYTQSLGNFDVVERRELARVLKEQKLGGSGLLDKNTIAKIGEILGIDAIVTGSIAYLGKNIKINARMIGVENAKVFAAAARKIPKDETVEELLRQSARQSSSVGQSVAASSGVQSQRHDVYFQNSLLHVSPAAINRSKDKKSISLALQFKNLTNEKIYLAVVRGYDKQAAAASIMSNAGNAIGGCTRYCTDKVRVTGLSALYGGDRERKNKKNYTEIDPQSNSTVIFTFKSRQEIEGSIFSFSVDMLRHQGSRYTKFPIGIPNIELR